MNALKDEIVELEEKLRRAMLESNIEALDALLSPELVFTSHLGQVFTKEDDLAAHRSGIIKLETLDLSDQQILITEKTAVVTVKAHIKGSVAGQSHEDDLRYTRVWAQSSEGTWQIIAGHASVVAA